MSIIYLLIVGLTGLFGLGNPIVPASISVNISEVNRNTDNRPISEYDNKIQGLRFDAVPEDSLCAPYPRYTKPKTVFVFQCKWLDTESYLPLTVANIEISTPVDNGIDDWEYDSKTLMVQPIMKNWFVYNMITLVSLLFLIIFGGLSISVWQENDEEERKKLTRASPP